MNLNSYSSHYGKFHQCTVSAARSNLVAFDLACSSYEPFLLSRMYPYETIKVDSRKPLMLALKAHFQTDVLASVICNTKYLFTICLGNDHMIYPVHKDLYSDSKLHLYATTYFVKDPEIIRQYMQSPIRPAYEHVYFYRKTVLYLDNFDLPSPGRCYFDDCAPTQFYRILFLTKEPLEYVLELAAELGAKNGVLEISYLTREVVARPSFIDFRTLSNPIYSDSSMVSAGFVRKKLSNAQPSLLLQDILLSYYKNNKRPDAHVLGILVEWPFCLDYEGARYHEPSGSPEYVALAINRHKPTRVVQVNYPYERYVEYNYVPPGPWTPVYFVASSLVTSLPAKKVVLDAVVLGLAYREAFFCFDKPLLEGHPHAHPASNTEYLLSTADFEGDPNVRVLDAYEYDERYALMRVRLKDVAQECWCLTNSEGSRPKPVRLPHLVREWLGFFREVKEDAFPVDVGILRLALMLAKHDICFDVKVAAADKASALHIAEDSIQFYMKEKMAEFINEARLVQKEGRVQSQVCSIS